MFKSTFNPYIAADYQQQIEAAALERRSAAPESQRCGCRKHSFLTTLRESGDLHQCGSCQGYPQQQEVGSEAVEATSIHPCYPAEHDMALGYPQWIGEDSL